MVESFTQADRDSFHAEGFLKCNGEDISCDCPGSAVRIGPKPDPFKLSKAFKAHFKGLIAIECLFPEAFEFSHKGWNGLIICMLDGNFSRRSTDELEVLNGERSDFEWERDHF